MRRTKLPVIGAGALFLLALAGPVLAEGGGKKGVQKTAAPAAPSPAPVAAAAPSAEQAKPGASTTVRLQDLEQRLDELKEALRRQNARAALLDPFSHGTAGSRVSIRFDSALSRVFAVTGVRLVIDGAVHYAKDDPSGALGGPAGVAMWSGMVPPGDHTVQVIVELQGSELGVFSYMRGYRFQVRSTHSFTATEGRALDLDASAWEKGDVTTPFDQRPALRYTEKVASDQAGAHP